MNTQSIAKHVVSGMGAHEPGAGGGERARMPKGIGVGHVAAAERLIEAHRDGKPVELAGALKDFMRLVLAEDD